MNYNQTTQCHSLSGKVLNLEVTKNRKKHEIILSKCYLEVIYCDPSLTITQFIFT